MGGTPDVPTPQSPGAVADTQQKYNIDAAAAGQAASNVNQFTPYGSLTYEQSGTGPGGIPLYTATQKLTPEMQAIVSRLQGDVTGSLNNANYGGKSASDVIGNTTSGMVKDMLDKETSYLSPFFKQQTDQMDAKLINQGLTPGTPAYQQAMNNLLQSQNQGVTGFLAQAQPAAYQQATSQYLLPLQTASAEMGLMNPSALTSSFVNPSKATVNAPDYTSVVNSYNQAQMAAYNAQMQQQGNMMSGLFGIPSSVLGGWAQGGFAGLGGAGAAASAI